MAARRGAHRDPPAGIDGRVLHEALGDGPPETSVDRVETEAQGMVLAHRRHRTSLYLEAGTRR